VEKIIASQGAKVVAVGIDPAKTTFSVCGLDAAHRTVLERTSNRARTIATMRAPLWMH
jgi:hypothetical protein